MNHGSLFSGIGGFDLAAEWMGWDNVFHCEIEPFPRQVLNYYWPQSISYEDIKQTDFTIHRGQIDVLTGGFPCQPYSHAGLRKGKEDERHLWPEMLRAIHEIKPRWIVGENVLGLVSWNGGLVFEEVQADLEAEGYEVQPYVLPAASVGAPHRRDRVWFIAYSKSNRDRRVLRSMESQNGSIREPEECGENNDQFGDDGAERITPNTPSSGLEAPRQTRIRQHEKEVREGVDNRLEQLCRVNADPYFKRLKECDLSGITEEPGQRDNIPFNEHSITWENFPTQPPVCDGNNGLSSRLDGITFPRWRNESIKAGGNAIVPQVALQIFKAIEQYEHTKKQ